MLSIFVHLRHWHLVRCSVNDIIAVVVVVVVVVVKAVAEQPLAPIKHSSASGHQYRPDTGQCVRAWMAYANVTRATLDNTIKCIDRSKCIVLCVHHASFSAAFVRYVSHATHAWSFSIQSAKPFLSVTLGVHFHSSNIMRFEVYNRLSGCVCVGTFIHIRSCDQSIHTIEYRSEKLRY